MHRIADDKWDGMVMRYDIVIQGSLNIVYDCLDIHHREWNSYFYYSNSTFISYSPEMFNFRCLFPSTASLNRFSTDRFTFTLKDNYCYIIIAFKLYFLICKIFYYCRISLPSLSLLIFNSLTSRYPRSTSSSSLCLKDSC